ncbi:MAG: hypothetical protein OEW64_06420 [Gammaproteobacteria bacterium]|nr:hypothetical protein [Gammaproteobacteria bacterium]MDH5303713.1 hypothetical protein [Gammaproteobacteria bacterium]MDH5322705.1 hypothetical protein [Gammaproteobacteria bacterium]
MKKSLTLFSAMLLTSAAGANLQDLSIECEIAVARSAAPLRLRADASVYALQDGEYKRVIEGAGPLTCIVERNDPDSIVPQCLDRAGVDTILPALIHRSLMSLSGATFQEIQADFKQRADNGEFKPAPRAGVSYMMSNYNYTYIAPRERVMKIAPHVMFYAPHVSNHDIGGSFESMVGNVGTPFLFDEGVHGYMIVYTEHEADSTEVAEACRGQLNEAPPSFTPFPQG